MPDPRESPGRESAEPSLELFVGEPTRQLSHWAWLWQGDHTFPLSSHRGGLLGRAVVFLKRLLRPIVRLATADLWDRQRIYNLILAEKLDGEHRERMAQLASLRSHVDQIHRDFQGAIEAHAGRLEELDLRSTRAMEDVMHHNDALFSRVDQKLDRYRREAKGLWSQLGAFIAAQESQPPRPLAEVQREQTYLDLELRYRGSEEDIAERVAAYLPYLQGRGTVLDLGCGRGEALQVFAQHDLNPRGIDSSGEMVARCRGKGLQAEEADLFAYLEALDEASLGAIVSFHVIEHLPAESLERLIRLAWRALEPKGVLILETPSPLSLVMSARNFWIDPTHQRPVHPASLEVSFRAAGFEPVHRVDLHPFPADQRLPEIELASLPEEQRPLADHLNRLRDLLDDLLYGHRDFGMVGHKG